jgi:phage virion morphogenesis protein
MAGATLDIDLSELGDIGRKFERAIKAFSDVTPMMDEIGAMLVTSTQDRFEKGQGPDGDDWLQSIRVQEAQGNAQTLVDSARLRDSITHEPGNDQVEVGTNVIYGAIHQFGGQTGRNKSVTMPARSYLGISSDDEREIENIVDDYLAEALQ